MKMKNIAQPQQQPQQVRSDSIDAKEMQTLKNRMDCTEKENASIREIIERYHVKLNEIEAAAVTHAHLEELEQTLINRLDEPLRAQTVQYAEKSETKKALKQLERQLKNLYEIVVST